ASSTGTAYVTGTTFSSSYPTVRPSQATYVGGSGDAFVAKLEPSSVRVFITTPAESATVSGTVWSDIWAENYVGTSNTYTLSIGGSVVATGTANNHATLAWDSRSVADGPQTLTATLRDSAGDGDARRDRRQQRGRRRDAQGLDHQSRDGRDGQREGVVRRLGGGYGRRQPDLHAQHRRRHPRQRDGHVEPRHAAVGLDARGQR